ncbi:sugar ABC transporter ATP-binding protein [Vibrio nigripulchritudo]|uniref:sugar ABC transporter ATP-binding protein n=1 Tax=Vibrio nigripulchritudo TaxID=28173 RepID=UPI0005FA3BA4|nr:sugar ABC transporter ATP-binding protein [Vibrio nigripulchritudo]KJY78743.1 lantibiotic ABC transporter permease [Vibrio nigripulchritudo]
MANEHPLIEVKDLHRYFGGVKALQGVNFSLKKGEVHALIGENGAGKSTLMKVIGGEYKPTKGQLRIKGKETVFRSPKDAFRSGIAVIHQEMVLAPDLSIAENIFLKELPGLVNRKALQSRASELIRKLGFKLDPSLPVGELPVAHQQIVEIAKALSTHAKIIVFDEPTAVLSEGDAQRLLTIIDDLRKTGVAIVYISHRLDEVLQIADRITVLKDGQSIETLDNTTPESLTVDDLIPLMVGRPLKDLFGEKTDHALGDTVLSIENLSDGKRLSPFNMDVRAGEILGLGGLVGAGRTEAMRLLFGADKASSGTIKIDGEAVSIHSPYHAVKHGIGLVPEDRKAQGTVLEFSIAHNITMANLRDVLIAGDLIHPAREARIVTDLSKKLTVKYHQSSDPVSSLSGGNQQKVVLAKWIHAQCKVLILDEPTRGVDVGAKVEIYTLIRYLATLGVAVIVISSEHQELFGLCDRILVMREGEITGELTPDDYQEVNLLRLAMIATDQQAAS